jgi:hypothetical protein
MNYVDGNQPGYLLGATRGGSVFSITPEFHEANVDGAKGAVEGDKRIARIVAKIETNIVEIVPWILTFGMAGSTEDQETRPGYSTITRALKFLLNEYQSTVVLVGEVRGKNVPIICGIRNAFSDGPLTINVSEGAESTIKLSFVGHFDPDTIDDEPWFIRGLDDAITTTPEPTTTTTTTTTTTPEPGTTTTAEPTTTSEPLPAIVGQYKGEDNPNDSSVWANNGVWQITPKYANGSFSPRCFEFDYTPPTGSGCIDIPSSPRNKLDPDGKFSMRFYGKRDTTDSNEFFWVYKGGKGDGDAVEDWAIGYYHGKIRLWLGLYKQPIFSVADIGIGTAWSGWLWTYNAGFHSVYINGVNKPLSTNNKKIEWSDRQAILGYAKYGNTLHVKLDEVEFWDGIILP